VLSYLSHQASIRTKIVAAFAVVLCCTMALGGFALQRLTAVNAIAGAIREDFLPTGRVLGDVAQLTERIRSYQGLYFLADNEAERRARNQKTAKVFASLNVAFQEYQPLISGGEERRLADAMTKAWSVYDAMSTQLDQRLAASESEIERARILRFFKHDMLTAIDAFRVPLDADAAFNLREGRKAAEGGRRLGRSATMWILAVLCLMAGLCVLIGWALVGSVSRPIAAMTVAMRRLADQDLAVGIPSVGRGDEIGAMAQAVQVFKESALHRQELEREGEQLRRDQESARTDMETQRADAEVQRVVAMQGLAERIENETRSAVDSIAQAMRDMAAKADEMSHSVSAVERTSSDVGRAAGEALGNTQSVAAAAGQLDAAIAAINRQVGRAREVTASAVSAAGNAEVTIVQLGDVVGQIGTITQLITDIARQSNLLGINASVEAARAGEAGRGFAVVAGEVKSLSQRTARATADIGQLIASVQDSAQLAVAAVKAIGGHVSGVDEVSLSIASAVQQQASATRAIAKDIAQASSAAQAVSTQIEHVTAEAQGAGTRARQVSELSAGVAEDINGLRSTLVRVVRTSTEDVDRRRFPRYTSDYSATLHANGASHTVVVTNLSEGGAMLEGVPAGAPRLVLLTLPQVARPVECDVLTQSGALARVKFRTAHGQSDQIVALVKQISASATSAPPESRTLARSA
jgi:methyl-accepting chemotaxis protein